MLMYITTFGVLILLFLQCYGQVNQNDSMNSLQRYNKTLNQNGWQSIIKNTFGGNETLNNSTFITSNGFKALVKSLGLRKKSNKTVMVSGNTIKCLSSTEMLRWYQNRKDTGLTEKQFMDVCPVLLIQIHSRVCRPIIDEAIITKDYLRIWLYSSGAVLLCSLVGLVVVWLIPILPKAYYNSISQLLIALAVGSLTGDALLHLIPHALLDDSSGGHSHGKGSTSHSQMVWKSLVAFIGIHLFFITERITILCQNFKSKRKSKIKQSSHDNIYEAIPDGDVFVDPDKIGVRFAGHKSSSIGKPHWASKSRKYSSSSRELEHATSHNGLDVDTNNIGVHLCNRPKNKPHVNSDCPDSMNINLCHTINPYSMVEEEIPDSQNSNVNIESQIPLINGNVNCDGHQHEHIKRTSTDRDNNYTNKDDDKLIDHICHDSNSNNVEVKIVAAKRVEPTAEIGAGGATVMSSLAHPFQNKPHGHHHGHSHDLSSVKAIAYTVIAGDGLHNFCDGIAIGAAFANDIRGGLSTAIAVLCHELPHELGDFVVLLHAGMSFRTAIFYNLLSSIFCAAGMVIGVLLGALPSVSSWIFMITAGMFLYIALVDMMPELSTRRLQGNKLFHRPSILFLWQNIGLLLGGLIMLMIALYEESMF